MKNSVVYFSSGINQTKHSLSRIKNQNIIVYGSSNRIITFNTKENRVTGVSKTYHGDYINCIKVIESKCSDDCCFLTTSTDGTAKLWLYKNVSDENKTNCELNCIEEIATLKGHQGTVTCGSGLFLSYLNEGFKEKIFVATNGDDFCIRGWVADIKSSDYEELFCYKLPGRSLALDILVIPCLQAENKHWPLIAYGGDDSKIHILVSKDGRNYEPSCYLPGHQDWVTCLSYCHEGDDILLSSGSKEGTIRLWRISFRERNTEEDHLIFQIKPTRIKVWKFNENPLKEGEAETTLYLYCTLESVLQGHDGFVSHLDWYRNEDGFCELLSCAKTEDRSVIIWGAATPEKIMNGCETGDEEGLWLEKARLGEVGGNREGFLCSCFAGSDGEQRVAAVSYQGGFHLWNFMENTWIPQPVVSGHFDQVVDLDWDKEGRYLVSVSKDQTTRLHSQWEPMPNKVIWQEVARPQVHGYDMACVSCLSQFLFASGAEEKVVRGFTSTKNFFKRMSSFYPFPERINQEKIDNLPEVASVPSLGLSNKAVDAEKSNDLQSTPNGTNETELGKGTPTEDELMLGTLWSEVAKLYGHGNEILALASSLDGSMLASSCRAATSSDAGIIIWDTSTWKQTQTLHHHRLSVTQLAFSPCGSYLLSVSRDRSWAIFTCSLGDSGWTILAHSGSLSRQNQHSRIIWSCAWVPDQTLCFVTGSRDKTAVVWKPIHDEEGRAVAWKRARTLKAPEEITAVAVHRIPTDSTILLAVGGVDGSLYLKGISLSDETEEESQTLESKYPLHGKTIRRLKFRPANPTAQNDSSVLLASCGNDQAVVLYKIYPDL